MSILSVLLLAIGGLIIVFAWPLVVTIGVMLLLAQLGFVGMFFATIVGFVGLIVNCAYFGALMER